MCSSRGPAVRLRRKVVRQGPAARLRRKIVRHRAGGPASSQSCSSGGPAARLRRTIVRHRAGGPASGGLLGSPGASWGLLKPPGASWGPPGGLLGPPGASWGRLRPPGASWGLLGPPGASWGLLGPPEASRGLLGASWRPPGAAWGLLGPPEASWGFLGSPGAAWGLLLPLVASWGVLGPPGASWGLLGPPGASWSVLVHFGAPLGLLGLLGASWAVLGILGLPGASWGSVRHTGVRPRFLFRRRPAARLRREVARLGPAARFWWQSQAAVQIRSHSGRRQRFPQHASLPPVMYQAGGAAGAEQAAEAQLGMPDAGLVAAQPDWLVAEEGDKQGMVWLVTFASVLDATAAQSDTPLLTLANVTRGVVRDAVLDAIANPARGSRGGRPSTVMLGVQKMVVFEEEPKHFHVALKLTKKMTFLPLKLALRHRSGLASHWSPTHTQWWSAVRYGTFATERKTFVDEGPLVWVASGGELNLYEESQEPFNAAASKRRREAAAARAGGEGAGKKAKAERFSSVDFKALVLAEGLMTANAVMEYAQQKGSAAVCDYVSRHQSRLRQLLSEAEDWSRAPEAAALERQSDWALLGKLSEEPCTCTESGPCEWLRAAGASFRRNSGTLDERRFAACLAKVIAEGPGKNSRVPLLVGVTNAGKSTVLDPIDVVFGPEKVFHTPAIGSSMPLSNLAVKEKRFVYFDDFHPVAFASSPHRSPTLPVITFLKLFAGQHLEVQVPLNQNLGNVDLAWRRGAAITSKMEGLWDVRGCVTQEDVRHMQSRVEQFSALEQVPAGEMKDVPKCKNSFAAWLLTAAAQFANGSAPAAAIALRGASESADREVEGLEDLLRKAHLPASSVAVFCQELSRLGVVDVRELGPEDWLQLHSLASLRPFEHRRLALAVGLPVA